MIKRTIILICLFLVMDVKAQSLQDDIRQTLTAHLETKNDIEALKVMAISQKIELNFFNQPLWQEIILSRLGVCAENHDFIDLQEISHLDNDTNSQKHTEAQLLLQINRLITRYKMTDVQPATAKDKNFKGYYRHLQDIPWSEINELNIYAQHCSQPFINEAEQKKWLDDLLKLRDQLIHVSVNFPNSYLLDVFIFLQSSKIEKSQRLSDWTTLSSSFIENLGHQLFDPNTDNLRLFSMQVQQKIVSLYSQIPMWQERCSQIAIDRLSNLDEKNMLPWISLINLHNSYSQKKLPDLLTSVFKILSLEVNSTNKEIIKILWLQSAYYHKEQQPLLALQELQQVKSLPTNLLKYKKNLTLWILNRHVNLLTNHRELIKLVRNSDLTPVLTQMAVDSLLDDAYNLPSAIDSLLNERQFPSEWLKVFKQSSISTLQSWVVQIKKQHYASAAYKQFCEQLVYTLTVEEPSKWSLWHEKAEIILSLLPPKQQVILLKKMEQPIVPASVTNASTVIHELKSVSLLPWFSYLPVNVESSSVTFELDIIPFHHRLDLFSFSTVAMSETSANSKPIFNQTIEKEVIIKKSVPDLYLEKTGQTEKTVLQQVRGKVRPTPYQQFNVFIEANNEALDNCLRESLFKNLETKSVKPKSMQSVRLTATILTEGKLTDVKLINITDNTSNLPVPSCFTKIISTWQLLPSDSLESLSVVLNVRNNI